MPNETTAWVLTYILRFAGEEGEWAQAVRKAYRSEQAAHHARAETGNPDGYSICKVEISNEE